MSDTGVSQLNSGIGVDRFALTPREAEIAGLIARGLTNRQIAEALVITPGTTANHVAHILGKLGFRSRTEVAVWHCTNRPDSAQNQ